MNVACDYEAPMQMLTTEKYIAARTQGHHWMTGESNYSFLHSQLGYL